MTDTDPIREIVCRAISDPEFRAGLVSDAEATLAAAGIDVTAEQIAAIKQMDVGDIAEDVDDRISKFFAFC